MKIFTELKSSRVNFLLKGKVFKTSVSIIFWVALWQMLSAVLKQEMLLPTPAQVALSIGRLVFEHAFWQSIGFSLVRVLTGFFLAIFLGCGFAVLAYKFSTAEALFRPLIGTLKATPMASYAILCLIIMPSSVLSVAISFFMALPVIYSNVIKGLHSTDSKMLEMADLFRVGFFKRLTKIYFFSVAPYFTSAISIALGLCWKAGIGAELIGIPRGSIGEKLYESKIYFDMPSLFAWTFFIVLISFLFEKIFVYTFNKITQNAER